MKPTTFTIIRHGETQWNKAGMIQGQSNSPLTQNGILQAEALADTLNPKHYDFLYSSDLGRTLQTAEILQKKINLPIQIDTGLRERHWGIFQGIPFSEIETNYPTLFKEFIKRNPDFCIPEGESFREFFNRTVTTFEAIAARHPEANIFVVTHGGNLDCLFRKTLHLPLDSPRCFSLKNVSMNIFTFNAGQWHLETWGDTCHFPALTSCEELYPNQ